MDSATRSPTGRTVPTVVQAALFGAAITVWLLTGGTGEDRRPWLVITVALFSVGGELLARHSAAGSAWVSTSSLGLVLTAVLCGGGPAAGIAMMLICFGWLRSRETGYWFRNNILIAAWFPLLTGLAFRDLAVATGAGEGDVVFYLLVFVAAVFSLGANILLLTLLTHLGRGPVAIARAVYGMVRPELAAQLFSAMLTVVAAFVTLRLRLIGLVMFGVFLAIFQYLLGELITSRHRSDRLRALVTTDELTGLANRQRFRDRIEERIAVPELHGPFSVLLMDLDRFKDVNDTLGHAYGDRLLRELGPRLVRAVGEAGVVARLGGDEFGLLLGPAEEDADGVEAAVARLLATVAEPFAIDELSLEVGASIGVARYPDDGADAGALLRCSDVAMYAAKEAQAGVRHYTARQDRNSVRRLSVLSDIRRALADDEIVVHYQPIVDLEHRRVTGAEGLVRWDHPEHGLIPPGAFVQSVEQSGLIGPLTRHVLESAIAECARWRADGRELSVAVNLSVRNLLDRGLPGEISRMLDAHHIPAAALHLEITESMIMTEPERASATVGRLSELGVRMSVDDFGTGYSSLANLRRLPIDDLKIDRSFVSPMLEDESDLIIVRSTINLGHDLGLRIIAEGVEDAETFERLILLGCDHAQGYHVSRPLEAAAFHRWLTDTPRGPSPERLPATASHTRPLVAGWTTTTAGLVVASPLP